MSQEKYVDESWKKSAEDEKDVLSKKTEENRGPLKEPVVDQGSEAAKNLEPENIHDMEVNFMNYVMSLGFQVMIFLGEVPNPANDEIIKNLEQAKLLIDTLIMLREKTKGNLNKQENDLINAYIYELQMKYVEIARKERGL